MALGAEIRESHFNLSERPVQAVRRAMFIGSSSPDSQVEFVTIPTPLSSPFLPVPAPQALVNFEMGGQRGYTVRPDPA